MENPCRTVIASEHVVLTDRPIPIPALIHIEGEKITEITILSENVSILDALSEIDSSVEKHNFGD
jgi:hypothetical protein